MELALNIENNQGTRGTNGGTEWGKGRGGEENGEKGGKSEQKESGKEKVTTTIESLVNGTRPWLLSSVSSPPDVKAELTGHISGCYQERFFYLCAHAYG